jgi:hypothetical protein
MDFRHSDIPQNLRDFPGLIPEEARTLSKPDCPGSRLGSPESRAQTLQVLPVPGSDQLPTTTCPPGLRYATGHTKTIFRPQQVLCENGQESNIIFIGRLSIPVIW